MGLACCVEFKAEGLEPRQYMTGPGFKLIRLSVGFGGFDPGGLSGAQWSLQKRGEVNPDPP